ncbi:MAG: DUF1501 domain-containing protein, partial [Planctomycetaceae bacterium]|nr:DUF1501 domain-containing protein [Planctomycetaceae bacterium]
TFDPKPEGPSAVRGEFSAISTAIPGVQFSEVLPKLATMADRLAIVRSMTHGNPNHVQASLPAGTGHAHSDQLRKRGDFPPSDTDFPPFGAVLSAVQPAASTLPTWVRIGPLMRRSNGTVLHGQLPGLLGQKYSSFDVDQKLLGDNVRVQAIEPQTELTPDRVTERRQLLGTIDQQRGLTEQSTGARDLEMFYQRAFSLLVSPQTRQAFELASEPATTRELYGKTEFGQRCLLARRLAEAGVPIVNVSYCHTPRGSWDTHGNNFRSMKEHLGPTLDTALSGLLIDLEQRGLLDSTLVVVNAEFGRTPKINARAGRDHWPSVYSLALAGAGTAAGNVYGASDESAAYPLHNPHDPADFAATLYHLLGVPPDTLIHDATGRPHTVIIGRPISGLLS